MKILGIASSPRNGGNSQTLVAQILSGAEKAGAVTELIRICGLNIQPCRGCNACKTGNGCILEDDMPELWEKIVNSDAVVLGAPIYWFRLNAQVYPFIDRFYGYFSPDFVCKLPKGKKIVVALTCGGEDTRDMISSNKYLKKAFGALGFVAAGFIWQNNCNQIDDIAHYHETIKQAEEVGRLLV